MRWDTDLQLIMVSFCLCFTELDGRLVNETSYITSELSSVLCLRAFSCSLASEFETSSRPMTRALLTIVCNKIQIL